MARFWLGSDPEMCDICGEPIIDEFVDGRTRQGPWGMLCPSCHEIQGVGLGVGRGQKYRKQPDGQWLKIEALRECTTTGGIADAIGVSQSKPNNNASIYKKKNKKGKDRLDRLGEDVVGMVNRPVITINKTPFEKKLYKALFGE